MFFLATIAGYNLVRRAFLLIVISGEFILHRKGAGRGVNEGGRVEGWGGGGGE